VTKINNNSRHRLRRNQNQHHLPSSPSLSPENHIISVAESIIVIINMERKQRKQGSPSLRNERKIINPKSKQV
jgi:hypothetical protein